MTQFNSALGDKSQRFKGALQRRERSLCIQINRGGSPFFYFLFCTWMFWLSPTVLCVFTFLIHTRTFFPTPPAPPIPPHPHLSCTTSVSCEGPSGSITTFLSLPPPPCVNSLQIPVALQAAFMFSSLFPLFHVLWCTEKECTQLSKLHLCLEDCMGSRCQVSLNPPTHPTAATHRIPH